MSTVRVRIAPSPTGYPHIGTVFQALVNYIFAKKHQGKFAVRIEDTDQTRFVADAETAIFSALKWFGLEPDESPIHGGEFGPYRQSERLPLYQKYADELLVSSHAYRCFCSRQRLDEVRKQMQADGKPPMYDRHCRKLDPSESEKLAKTQSSVIRLKVPDNQTIICHDEIRGDIAFDSSVVDDQVIMKSDGFPTYHLAVVVDDHLMEISHMVRGEEWISSSPKHILLYDYFGWDKPKFIHTPVLRNPDKSKLSKRHGHASVAWYRENGYLKEAVLNFLITRVWNHPEGKEIFGIEEMIAHFDFKDMHIQGPIVDLAKLDWINGTWIRNLAEADLIKRLKPFKSPKLSDDMLLEFLPHIKDRLHKLTDITDLTDYLIDDPAVPVELILKEAKTDANSVKAYLQQVIEVIKAGQTFDAGSLENNLRALQEKVGWKPRPAFMPIRLCVTGRQHTPPLFDVMVMLGSSIVIKRLSHALTKL
ncbi:glutamate--tRNA ligase [Microgenomates group bacterium RIFCSPLOWO2_01_FULL_47_10]|nr:MAG: glutamate--tRNA ligase [Microgenomates group bacterium RIFCSPLOWO2_01_FULL_47_10]